MSGLLCCGNIVFDVVVRPVSELRWNTTHWVESVRHTMGGNGANTAYAAAILGARVKLLGWVGNDPAGTMLTGKLAAAGVDVSAVHRSAAPTATTVSLVNPQGDRFLLHSPGVSLEAFSEPVQLDAGLLEGMTHFHLANLFAIPGLRRHGAGLLRQAKAAGLVTTLDTGWDQHGRWLEDLGPALAWTDLVFVNREETIALAGTGDLAEAARIFAAHGAGMIVFKLAAAGCAVWEGGEMEHIPAFEVEAVDTTGAGDCFAGAFLATWSGGAGAREAARLANAAAALSVTCLGATEGLRPRAELEAWMRTARLRQAPQPCS
ncbi:MAG: carbohydrate kinase family protein, partial [Bryobacteraceae bacterium]